VSRLRRFVPPTNLGRARLAAVTFALICLAGQMTQVGRLTGSWLWDNGARLAIVLLGVAFVATYLRGRAWAWDPVLLPALVFAAGSALPDPLATIGLALALLVVQSLYGSTRAWAVRSVLAMAAVPAIVLFSPGETAGTLGTSPATVVTVVPQIMLVTVMTRAVFRALARQELAAARDAALADTGARVIAAADLPALYDIGYQVTRALIATSPGIVMVMARRGADGFVIEGAVGLRGDFAGQRLPETTLTDPRPALVRWAPAARHWHVEAVSADRYRLLGSARELPHEILDSFRTLSNQIRLGEASRLTHAELDHRANHDHLTQLPTRAKFFRVLAAAVDAGPPGTVALLNIDLDDFKQVNDTYGHGAGDELLVQVAERIAAVAGDHGLGGRFGGDEFALLLTGLGSAAEAEQAAELLCARLAMPQRLASATVTVGASIGVAITEPGVTAAELTRRADIAMYSAKAHGKNRVAIFTADQHGEVARHRTLEDQLPHAIARGEIAVLFQPYCDVGTGAWLGVEALFQWRHPTLGKVDCRELLELAERTGDLPAVTEFVLRTVGAQLVALPGELPVGMNIGAHQLLDPGFADTVLGTLAETGLPAHRLALEMVESGHMDDPMARDQLRRLAGQGVRIALDDFGTGYVSFATLRSFPIHQLKIDAGFLDGDPAALDLVLSVGHLLGTETIVLGARTADHLARLHRVGALAAQSDQVAPIMDVAELADLLAAGPSPLVRT
jgi:diguanylate cyclase (GGDEF)-like protein